jgi:aspartate aminotransferase
MKLAERVKAAQPSVTLALNARAQQMAAEGRDVVSLAAGEPDFDTPTHIGDAAVAAIRAGFTKYTATRGTPELRKAVCEKLKRDNALAYTPEQVLVSSGAKHSLYNAFQALLQEGDEAIVFAPYWVSYPDMVALTGAKPVVVHTRAEDGFVPRVEDFKKALTPRTKAVVLNSPNNPTSALWPGEVLEALGKELVGKDIAVVSDDIYEKLTYQGKFESILNRVPELAGQTLVINGVSKTYAMTGWRIGYCAGPKDIIDGMSRIQDQSTSSPCSISQKAAFAALTGSEAPMKAMVAEFAQRARFLAAGLRKLPGVTCVEPLGAFYALPDVSAWLGKSYKGAPVGGSMRLAEILLNDFEMAVVPGAPFAAEGHLRLSFAASMAQLEKGLQRLGALAGQLG